MKKVLCTLPNASTEIGGVKFESHAKGMVSESVPDDVAERLASIPGYQIVGSKKKEPTAAEKKEAEEKAAAEKEAAEKAAAEQKAAEEAAAAEKAAAELKAAEDAAAAKGKKPK